MNTKVDTFILAVTSVAQQVFPRDLTRKSFIIANNSASTIYIGWRQDVDATSGIPVLAGQIFPTSAYIDEVFTKEALYAISVVAGPLNLSVTTVNYFE